MAITGVEAEPVGTIGVNDSIASAQAMGPVPAGDDLTISGDLGPVPVVQANPGEVGDSLGTSLDTGLVAGSAARYTGLVIGDGAFASTGDYDIFRVELLAGEKVAVDVDTASPFAALDPVVAVYGPSGLVAFNDDFEVAVSWDSALQYQASTSGSHYVLVGGRPNVMTAVPANSLPSDPSVAGTGPAVGSQGPYDLTISRGVDVDAFTVDLRQGDVIHLRTNGSAEVVQVAALAPLSLLMGSFRSTIGTQSPASPFSLLGGNAQATLVVPSDGTYGIAAFFGNGPYTLDLSVRRPGLEQRPGSDRQILFVDFDGGTVNPVIWGGPNQLRTFSPLESFMPGWGLTDQDGLIDAILAALVLRLSQDLRTVGLAGDRDASGLPGQFDVEIRNSRDHRDPFTTPNVSRVIIGGTISEMGIRTIGVAQSIDIGNYEPNESAIVLLDMLSATRFNPDSLNQFDAAGDKQGLVAQAVGTIAAHEAGHFFGNFHTDNTSAAIRVMDRGGNIAIFGVGPDKVFRTADDTDVRFGQDTYASQEGFAGTADSRVHTAFGLTTGATAATRPQEVTNLIVVPSPGTITATWTPAVDDGGDDVFAYQADLTTVPGGVVQSTDVGVRQPLVISGLATGTYDLEICGSNHVGKCPAGLAAQVTVPQAVTPGVARHLSSAVTETSAILRWEPPTSDGGSPITAYSVSLTNSAGLSVTHPAGPARSYQVSGLTTGEPYTFSVTAINAVGQGTPSASFAFIPAGLPGPPRDVVAVGANGSIDVTWIPPLNDGGTALTGYVVTEYTSTGIALAESMVAGPPHRVVVSNGVSRYVGVQAINPAGRGQEALSATVTARTIPDVPFNLQAVAGQAGDHSRPVRRGGGGHDAGGGGDHHGVAGDG